MLYISFSFAQVHEIPLNMKSNKQKAISKSTSGIRFSFSQNKILSKTQKAKDGNSFTNIWLKGSYPNGEVGTPNLPAYKKLIRIPKGSTPSVNVVSHTEQLITLKEKGINLPIYPNQPSVSKNQDTANIKFEIKKEAYAKKAYSNTPIATIEVLGNLRSATIARLVVNPVDYNPGDGLIKVYNDVDVDVTFSGALSDAEELAFDAKTYSPYFDITYKSLDQSSKSSYTDHPDRTKYPVKMLIISNRMFEPTLQPFIQWKTSKGFNVITKYTDEIGSTATLIKTYIQQEYNSATPENPAPTFLVIVGDVGQVEASASGSETSELTDLYYACVDGDMFPDMYYGRLSATTIPQLKNIIDKILYYEKYKFVDPSYLNQVTLIAGVDGYWNPRVGQPTIKYGTANYFNQSNGFENVNEYGVTSDPNNPNLKTTSCEYNNSDISVGFINYTAHCGITEWTNPTLTNSSITGFSNTNKYPVVIGNCCLSGNFGSDECIGEAWIRAQNKGAVTYIGSSPNTSWFEDFYWAVGAFNIDAHSSGYVPSFEETTTGAYDAPFVSKYVTTGGIVFAGNLAVTEVDVQNYPSQSSPLYYWQAYNILGDPSLMPYFTEAEANAVSHNPTITIGETSFNVNALANSYIAISKDNQLLGTSFVNTTGEVNIPITPITETGDVVIVVTRPQTIPVIDTIAAILPTGPYLLLNSFLIDDHLLNNNGKADYNETFSINLKVKNVGIADATNVKVKLLGVDSNISIESPDSIGVPNISWPNTIDVDNAFTFKTHENIPDQYTTNFTLKFYSDQGSWTSKLKILLNAPIISIGKFQLDDNLPGGDKDGLLNPGESCKLLVPIINQGHSLAKDITLTISIPDSLKDFVSVSNIQNTPFSLEKNNTSIVPFNFSVVASLRQELIIPIKLQAMVVEPSGLTQLFESGIEVTHKGVSMSSGTITTDFTYFFDSGGKDGEYKNNENYTLTFKPYTQGQTIRTSFLVFNLEQIADCRYDKLTIYDGLTTNDSLIGAYCGTNSPQVVKATNSDGALTFVFHSDQGDTFSGWKAIIESVESTSTPIISNKKIRVYPNPVTDILFVESPLPITRITLVNTLGTVVLSNRYSFLTYASISTGSLMPGVYILIIYHENSIPEKALIIKK